MIKKVTWKGVKGNQYTKPFRTTDNGKFVQPICQHFLFVFSNANNITNVCEQEC